MNSSRTRPLPQSARARWARGLLLLAICWQALLVLMPVAQAKAASDGRWETICTLHGSAQIWLAAGATNDDHADHQPDKNTPQTRPGSDCPLCLMSHGGLLPSPEFGWAAQPVAVLASGQPLLTTPYLTRAWAAPATGPPLFL